MKIRKTCVSFIFIFGFMSLATALGYVFKAVAIPETNIVLLYILAVLFTAMYTHGFAQGIIASVIATFAFNYFFTEPYYTFSVYNPSYIVTFIVMTIVAIITSTLTSKEKLHAKRAMERERETKTLYAISNLLSDADSMERIAEVAACSISVHFACNAGCFYFKEIIGDSTSFLQYAKSNLIHRELQNPEEYRNQLNYLRDDYFEDEEFMNWRIDGQDKILGAIRIPIELLSTFTDNQKKMLHSMIENIGLAMERIVGLKERLKDKEMIEEERYRANLLRSISHDLRTPLMGIMGSAEMISEMSREEDHRKQLAKGIYSEADWLHSLVENILGLTRLQDGKLVLRKNKEALEEVIASAVMRIEKRVPEYEIFVTIPEEYVEVPMDARLIEQVIVNLLDNAVKHTKPEEGISLAASVENSEFVKIVVEDGGEGIAQADISNIFNMFYTSNEKHADAKHGMGLGLAICETVVKAHGGTITGGNREKKKGAMFAFTLPL